jgi:predicted transposase YdaD
LTRLTHVGALQACVGDSPTAAAYDSGDIYQEVFAEGLEEGRDEARRQTALNLLRQTSLDDAAIAAATDLDADAVRALRQVSAAG